MNKNVILALSVISLFMLAGCQGGGDGGVSRTGFIGGTTAVVADFLTGSPPSEVYQNTPFEIILNVENKGEVKVLKSDMKIKLVGFDRADFSTPDIEKSPTEDLEPAYIDAEGNLIPGTVTYVTFDKFSYNGLLPANNEYTVRAETCYKYGTKAQADVCVLQDLAKREGKVCDPVGTKAVSSSSAPVQIGNFQENIAGTDKVTFSFEIQHRGTGAISDDAACSVDDIAHKNKVQVTVGGMSGISCTGIGAAAGVTGTTTLYDGKKLIRCTVDTSSATSDYTKKITVDLVYNYKENKQTTVLVKKAS
ncbi:MAG: hypothetical protein ABIJ08_01010 [Nanoarchaeota archaeon]